MFSIAYLLLLHNSAKHVDDEAYLFILIWYLDASENRTGKLTSADPIERRILVPHKAR